MNEEFNEELYGDDIEEEYMDALEENAIAFSEALPAIVREFQASAVEVSHYNDIPAAISFFNILGQITKDFIRIPNGRSIEDSRVHFCWVQTSGTGKSTLWNFVGPVANKTFELINGKGTHPSLHTNSDNDFVDDIMARKFDTFGVTDYTDSVLIGNWGEQKVMETNPDTFEEKWTGEMEPKRNAGLLEGSLTGFFVAPPKPLAAPTRREAIPALPPRLKEGLFKIITYLQRYCLDHKQLILFEELVIMVQHFLLHPYLFVELW